jgi:hypothetical protein
MRTRSTNGANLCHATCVDFHPSQASDEQDPGNVVEANINQSAAMLSRWCQTLNVGVDFESALKLKGMQKQMYRMMAVPIADTAIAKGGTHKMTMEDTRAALAGAMLS